MDARRYIKIRGANENNLKNIDVDIPRNELVVLTGLSGSGKSSGVVPRGGRLGRSGVALLSMYSRRGSGTFSS